MAVILQILAFYRDAPVGVQQPLLQEVRYFMILVIIANVIEVFLTFIYILLYI